MHYWLNAPQRVREIVGQHLTNVTLYRVHEGQGSDLAVTLRTNRGDVFVKAVSMARPRAEVHRIEVRVQEYLPPIAPRMLWYTEDDEWLVMCFEHVGGGQVDIAPGSSDLDLVAIVLDLLSMSEVPSLPVLPIEKKWAPFAPGDVLDHLRGAAMVHTDLTPANILRGTTGTPKVVDWAWPTVGAAWLDTSLMVPRLILAGHTPEAAEAWALTIPAWCKAERESIDCGVRAHLGFAHERGSKELLNSLREWQRYRQMAP
jgi:hypothetical protein